MTRVRIGRLGRPHGLRGEIALDSDLTVEELLAIETFVWKGRDGAERPLTLAGARSALPRPLVNFAGIGYRDLASGLTNGELWAEVDRVPDPGPGVAYIYQLVGCRVVTREGRELGQLADVWNTGAHPIYVVRGERELLLPAHEGVVRSVDLAGRLVTVDLPAGIEDL